MFWVGGLDATEEAQLDGQGMKSYLTEFGAGVHRLREGGLNSLKL